MAGDWIKIEHALPDKPEVFQLAELLGIDPDAVVGKLVRLWVWCDQQTVNGNALGVTDSFLDRITHQPGFSVALRKVGWLQARSGSLAIPHFDRHNGQTAKARAVTNRRVAAHRNKCNADSVTYVTPDALQKPLPEKRREENNNKALSHARTREEVRAMGQNIGIPPDVCDAFWDDMQAVGWIDRHQRPIHSVHSALAKFWRHWQSNDLDRRSRRDTEAQRDARKTGLQENIMVRKL